MSAGSSDTVKSKVHLRSRRRILEEDHPQTPFQRHGSPVTRAVHQAYSRVACRVRCFEPAPPMPAVRDIPKSAGSSRPERRTPMNGSWDAADPAARSDSAGIAAGTPC